MWFPDMSVAPGNCVNGIFYRVIVLTGKRNSLLNNGVVKELFIVYRADPAT
jgi:hypothetical protein